MSTLTKMPLVAAALIGLGTLAFSAVGAHPAQAQILPPPAAMARERHPELRRALRTLERTETDLRRSARDFGGHRAKAADLCHQAQLEVQLALQYDKN